MENVIPGETYFSVDFRDEELGVLQNLESYVAKSAKEIASQYELKFQIDPLLKVDPLPFSPEILKTIQHAADELEVKWQPIASGAGHDAQIVGQVSPTAMIFVPSCEGRSHCPEEYTKIEDIEKGTNVLLHTLLRLAQ
jgi:acetylornithine deacetylase/succinyl-diaminopimelate desuccinylase-like protein